MRHGSVAFSEIASSGFRLTGGFHLAEDQHAIRVLARIRTTSALTSLTKGRGIFRGPIFKRLYVLDSSLGRPYVSAKDLVHADIHPREHLSRRHGVLLNELELHEGMILVTCSGMNLGKAIWARADMDGLCASHDLIRIEPDEKRVPPGYLFAFLASHYGRTSIRRQIYGGNIKHIEPSHLVELPVPRLARDLEERISGLILEVAKFRAEAATLRKGALAAMANALSLGSVNAERGPESHAVFTISSRDLSRLDAHHFNPTAQGSADSLAKARSSRPLNTVAQVFTPGIFKRQHVDDPSFGYPYFSGSELFQATPHPRGHLRKAAPGIEEYVVHKNWLLLQDAGQLGGLIGRVVRVSVAVDRGVVSNHLMRIVCESDNDAGYLYALLSSPHGRLAVTRHAFGSSIPQLDPAHIGRIKLPWPDVSLRNKLAKPVLRSWVLDDEAMSREATAIRMTEEAIGGKL